MIDVKCDVCGRSCNDGYYATVTVAPERTSFGAPQAGEYHLCLPSDGGSVGCAQFLPGARKWIKEQQDYRRIKAAAQAREQSHA